MLYVMVLCSTSSSTRRISSQRWPDVITIWKRVRSVSNIHILCSVQCAPIRPLYSIYLTLCVCICVCIGVAAAATCRGQSLHFSAFPLRWLFLFEKKKNVNWCNTMCAASFLHAQCTPKTMAGFTNNNCAAHRPNTSAKQTKMRNGERNKISNSSKWARP